MSRVKGKNTRIEVDFRKKLWARGLRYRLGYKLLGKPDLVFVSASVAVFVDGCFWHGCPVHGQEPKTNKEFWVEKLRKNKQRDQRVTAELTALGWLVVRFWEHELKKELDRCIADLSRILELRKSVRSNVNTKVRE